MKLAKRLLPSITRLVIKMNLSHTMKRQVEREFLKKWEKSLRTTLTHFIGNEDHIKTDEILVQAYWTLNAKTWIGNLSILRELFGNNLFELHNILGQDAPVSLHQKLNRCLGSNISPDELFWRDLSTFINNNAYFKGRLIRTVQTESYHTIEDETTTIGIDFLNKKSFILREYQIEMIEAIYSGVVNEVPRLMVKLPTGSGKTRVALEAVLKLMNDGHVEVALWIADEKQLCEQAVDSVKSTFYGREQSLQDLVLISFFDSNGLIDLQKMHENQNHPMLIICTPHQLRENLNLIPNVDLFVMDEAHASIQQRSNLFEILGSKTMLGLSATPPTHWNETITLTPRESFDGRMISTKDHLIEQGILSNVTIQTRKMIEKIEYETLLKLQITVAKPKMNDPFVIYSILSSLRNDIERGAINSTLVFVDRVEQASILSAAFNALMPEHRSGYIEGNMSTSQRQRIIQQFREGAINVLFNVQMLREGFDAPNIDGVYLALITNPAPNSTNYIQMLGRGFRGPAAEGGTENCLVAILDFDHE